MSTRPVTLGTLLAALLLTCGCQRDEGDTVDPYVLIVFPGENVTVLDDIVRVRADARDNVGINQVYFMAEGEILARLTEEPYEFEWNTTAYPDCVGVDSFIQLAATAEDLAGNSKDTHRDFYIDNRGNAPIPVELFPPTNVTKHSATLSWEQSVDYDFSHYLLRRDTADSVTVASDSVARLGSSDSTSFTDRDTSISPFGLLEDTDYYYRVWVYDVYDSSSTSDSIASVHTMLPQPIALRATSNITKYTIELAWEPNSEDVDYYRLHRGLSAEQAELDSIAVVPAGTYSYIDTGLTARTTYYYYSHLFDEAGYTHNFSNQDVLETVTLTLPPPVLESQPQAITKYSTTIAWQTIADQEDSSWVELYRDTDTSVDSTDDLLYTMPLNDTHTFTDFPLQQNQSYSYRLRHRDSQDNVAWSNTLTMTTQSLEDVWSGGLGYTQGKYELILSWDRYIYIPDDFASYTLSRNGQTVFTSGNSDGNGFTDTGLAKDSTYLYRLVVSDTSGATVADSLDASTRDIYPAEIVRLEATDDWFYEIGWLPSDEPDSEFDHYELLRSSDTGESFEDNNDDNTADCLAGGNCVSVATYTNQYQLSHLDDDTTLAIITELDSVTADTTLPVYNYVVLTYDIAGQYVRSNIVGDTLYAPPQAVTLSGSGEAQETSIDIQWTRASWPSPALEDWLFSHYEVWRFKNSTEEPWETETSDPLAQFSDINITSYGDGPLPRGSFWYYAVIVRDIFGQGAVSNVVEGVTLP